MSVEGKGRLTKIRKAQNKATSPNKALLDMFSQVPKDSVKSVTYDNGTENTGRTEIKHIPNFGKGNCRKY
jgi:IS30 family transposase